MNISEYNSIVRQWAPHLLRFANRQVNNKDIAKDMVQDAFEVLWKNREELKPEIARKYLFTIVYRRGMDVFRKDKNNVEMKESHLEISDNQQHETAYSDRQLVRDAIAKLPLQYRQLILLRDLEGYDYKEIEEITGLSESQVKVYLFRARKALKQTITTMEAI